MNDPTDYLNYAPAAVLRNNMPLLAYIGGKPWAFTSKEHNFLPGQTDVSGRTESDPAAETLAGNILRYVSDWRPAARRSVVYAGEPAGKQYLQSADLVAKGEQRWLKGYYLDAPEEWGDPYRFFRW